MSVNSRTRSLRDATVTGGKPKRRRPKTDVGTVVLHWIVVLAVVINAATGFAIAADAPQRHWLRLLRGLLPQGEVWSLHVSSGVALLAVAVAYPVYLSRTGLTARIRFDRARLSGLVTGPARARWGAVNVLLYWLIFLVLLVQIGTGVVLYLGFGGTVVTVHYLAAVCIVVLPFAHVLAQLGHGRLAQILRIIRPTRRLEMLPPPDLIDLMRRHLERSAGERPPPTHRTLQLHPLSVAGAAAFATVAVAATVDVTGRATLIINAIAQAEAPQLDGDLSDPAWRKAPPITVETQQGANFGGSGASRVTVRALHDGTWAYLAFTWDDPTRSLKHLPLIKRADGWHLVQTRYDVEDEDSYYEDKFSVMLAETATMPAGGSIRLGPRPLADKPAPMSARGLHLTADGGIVDVWHWKAARGGLLGWMDDNHFGPPAEPTEKENAGKSRYKAGYQVDQGQAVYANNFEHQPPGGYSGALTPKRLPKNPAALASAMGPIDLDPDISEAANSRWWMTADGSEPYSPAADARVPVGTVIPGVLISGDYSGDRADVRCAAHWAAGRWTLEVKRRLETGSRFDTAIRSGVAMWVAAFDHSQTRHTRHMRPILLEVKP